MYVGASGIEVIRRILGVGWQRLRRLLTYISPRSGGKEREGINSGSEDKHVVRRAQMSGVDARWRDI